MNRRNLPTRYTKSERDTLSSLAKVKEADARVNLTRIAYVCIAIFPILMALTYVHVYVGPQVVLGILAIVGVILVGVTFSILNDRSQERAMNHAVAMAERLGKGINEAVAQNARTAGDAERASIRVVANEMMARQRVDANQQITQQRQQSALPQFDDDEYGYDVDAQYERYEEVY